MIQRQPPIFRPSYSAGGGGGGNTIPFPLSAGHFISAKTSLYTVFPRADGETTTWARHRKAYYDGSNAIQYRIPVGVRGGAWPYQFSVIAGPSGLTVGADLPADWLTNGPGNYGVVTWTPSGSVSGATVTIRITDQEGATIDVTWTVTTSSSTADFIFLDANSGNDSTGDGSYAAPYQTLSKAFGAAASTTNPNTILYFKTTGNYAVPNQTANECRFVIGKSPMALVGMPGVTPTLSMTSAWLTTTGSAGHNIYLENMIWDSGRSGANDFRNFWGGGQFHRVTAYKVSITNPVNGTVVDGNVTSFYFDSPGSQRDHFYIRECSDIGRVNSGTQVHSLFICFAVQNSLAEFNYTSGGGGSMLLKASTPNWTRRANKAVCTGNLDFWETICQIDGGIQTINVEDCYNIIDVSSRSGGSAGVVLNIGYRSGTGSDYCGAHWFYRNTVIGGLTPRNAATGNGPFTIENNVILANSGSALITDGATATYTNTGTECQGLISANIINASTYALTDTYRTNYLGTRGVELA
jgi:hypothetical protein